MYCFNKWNTYLLLKYVPTCNRLKQVKNFQKLTFEVKMK